MALIYVRPKAGLVLRLPEGGTLPAEGMEVEASLFWQRRVADGDVTAAAAEGASGQTGLVTASPRPGKQKEG